MRLLILMLIIPFLSYSQTFKESKIEVLKKYEKKMNRLNGESKSVSFSLVRRIDVDKTDTVTTVDVKVSEVSKEITSINTSLTIGGILGGPSFGAGGVGVNQEINRASGIIHLSKENLLKVTDFLGSVIKNKANPPAYDSSWFLDVDSRFQVALLYEAAKSNKFSFYMSLDGAEFQIQYSSGLELLKELGRIQRML